MSDRTKKGGPTEPPKPAPFKPSGSGKHPCPICSRDVFKGADIYHTSARESVNPALFNRILEWLRNDESDRLLIVKPRVGTVFEQNPNEQQTVCMACHKLADSCICAGF